MERPSEEEIQDTLNLFANVVALLHKAREHHEFFGEEVPGRNALEGAVAIGSALAWVLGTPELSGPIENFNRLRLRYQHAVDQALAAARESNGGDNEEAE